MSALRVRRMLNAIACALGAALASACGGGGGSAPIVSPPPPPPAPPISGPTTPGAAVATRGYSTGTFTFTFGTGGPPGETMTLASVPAPVFSCQAPACTAPLPPTDEVAITVGPAALPLSAVVSIGLSGFPPPSRDIYSFDISDQTVAVGYTTFNTSPTGGPYQEVYAYPSGSSPLTAFEPGRSYLLKLWPFQLFVPT